MHCGWPQNLGEKSLSWSESRLCQTLVAMASDGNIVVRCACGESRLCQTLARLCPGVIGAYRIVRVAIGESDLRGKSA